MHQIWEKTNGKNRRTKKATQYLIYVTNRKNGPETPMVPPVSRSEDSLSPAATSAPLRPGSDKCCQCPHQVLALVKATQNYYRKPQVMVSHHNYNHISHLQIHTTNSIIYRKHKTSPTSRFHLDLVLMMLFITIFLFSIFSLNN